MVIVIPSIPADAANAQHLQRLIEPWTAGHTVKAIHEPNPIGWPQGPCAMFRQAVAGLTEGQLFLWLEPDAAPMDPDAFSRLEAEFNANLARWPRLCWLGCKLTDRVSGVAVYRITSHLRAACRVLNPGVPFDLDLYRLFATGQPSGLYGHTSLIFDAWRWHGSLAELKRRARCSVLVHGVKDSSLLSASPAWPAEKSSASMA